MSLATLLMLTFLAATFSRNSRNFMRHRVETPLELGAEIAATSGACLAGPERLLLAMAYAIVAIILCWVGIGVAVAIAGTR